MNGNKPEKKFKAGAITATVWKNLAKKNGKEYSFYTIGIERNFKKGEEWGSTSSFRVADLPKVILVAQEAYKYLLMKETSEQTEEELEPKVETVDISYG